MSVLRYLNSVDGKKNKKSAVHLLNRKNSDFEYRVIKDFLKICRKKKEKEFLFFNGK